MDVYEKISGGEYVSAVPYPSRPPRPKILGMRISEIDEAEFSEAARAKKEYDISMQDYETAKKAHYADCAKLRAEFESDLIAHYELADHPKAQEALALAWDEGHSDGYEFVAEKFGKYAALMK